MPTFPTTLMLSNPLLSGIARLELVTTAAAAAVLVAVAPATVPVPDGAVWTGSDWTSQTYIIPDGRRYTPYKPSTGIQSSMLLLPGHERFVSVIVWVVCIRMLQS